MAKRAYNPTELAELQTTMTLRRRDRPSSEESASDDDDDDGNGFAAPSSPFWDEDDSEGSDGRRRGLRLAPISAVSAIRHRALVSL
jgi:hypothetical protein